MGHFTSIALLGAAVLASSASAQSASDALANRIMEANLHVVQPSSLGTHAFETRSALFGVSPYDHQVSLFECLKTYN
jgi:hypothetical protein